MELGCDHVKISGGEILRVEVERNFVRKDTAFWVGVGASASASTYNIGGGNLGDNGQGWTPPSSPVNFDVTAQFLVACVSTTPAQWWMEESRARFQHRQCWTVERRPGRYRQCYFGERPGYHTHSQNSVNY